MTTVWDFVRVMGVVWGLGIAALVVLWVWSWWDGRRREKAWDAEIDEMEREFEMERMPPTSEEQCPNCGRILSCVGTCSRCTR